MALPIVSKPTRVTNPNQDNLLREHIATRLPLESAQRQNALPPESEARCRAFQIAGQAVCQQLLGLGVGPTGLTLKMGVALRPGHRNRDDAEWAAIAVWSGWHAAKGQCRLHDMGIRFQVADKEAQRLLRGHSTWGPYLKTFSAQCRFNGVRFAVEHSGLIAIVAAELLEATRVTVSDLERICSRPQ